MRKAPHIYLGVEYWNRLFSSGPYHSLLSDRRNQLHTFFFINRQSRSCAGEITHMFTNTWNNIISWFKDRSERGKLIRSFNDAAKESFVSGLVPTLLKASISRGEREYRHQFSDRFNSGFRIKAFKGRELSRNELVNIGGAIISDSTLIRRLVVLGFDTLEVHGDVGCYGCRWQLKDFMQLPE